MASPIIANIVFPHRQRSSAIGRPSPLNVVGPATMKSPLTEPDAGSDVGASRTKAVDNGDGTWHLEGVKRFITNGDTDDMFENILHLVLARPEGAGPARRA